MSKKYKKTGKHLNYVEYLIILASTVTSCVSISAFASLVAALVAISCFTSSAIEIKICAITAGIKKCNSILKNNKKKHDKFNY